MPSLFVIGSGSAGLTAAIGLAKVGYDTTLVEEDYIGGDCTNFGCIPSKTLLHEARELHRAYAVLGQEKDQEFRTRADQALARTRAVVDRFREEESEAWLNENNVRLLRGRAKFASKNTLVVNDRTRRFDRCVVATGSRAQIPDIPGLEDTPYLTNKTIFDLATPPSRLVILGNGVIAAEMGEAFAMLGAKVTILGRSEGILKNSDPDHARRLQKHLESLGIECLRFDARQVTHHKENGFTLEDESGRKLRADALLVAAGRVPNSELNLELAGIDSDQAGIKINSATRTTNPDVYAIGDVASGLPNFTHFAYHMGKTVLANLLVRKFLLLPLPVAKIKPERNPSVVFTSLELAAAGLSVEEAREKFSRVRVYALDFENLDRAITNAEEGSLKVVTAGFFGRIVGVSLLAARAGEMLPEFQTLILEKRRVTYLNKLIRAYPTYTANLDNVFKEWLATLGKDTARRKKT